MEALTNLTKKVEQLQSIQTSTAGAKVAPVMDGSDATGANDRAIDVGGGGGIIPDTGAGAGAGNVHGDGSLEVHSGGTVATVLADTLGRATVIPAPSPLRPSKMLTPFPTPCHQILPAPVVQAAGASANDGGAVGAGVGGSSDDYRGDRNNSANGAGVGGSGGIGDGNVGLIGESMDTTGTLTSADFRPR